MIKKKGGLISNISIITGMILIISAVIILTADIGNQKASTENAKKALDMASELMGEVYDAYPEERGNSIMPSLMLEGIDTVGIIEVPQYGVKLAVNSCWDKKTANVMPCKYSGSVYNRDIVIGTSDREGQFSFASMLQTGAKLSFIDMEGGKYTYSVEKIEHGAGLDKEKLENGNWDLTVFVKPSAITGEYLFIRCKAE